MSSRTFVLKNSSFYFTAFTVSQTNDNILTVLATKINSEL